MTGRNGPSTADTGHRTVEDAAVSASRPRSRIVIGVVVLLGSLVVVGAALRFLTAADFDPTALIAFGERADEINEYAERELGRPVLVREQLGHDGKFFFIQASDPFFLEPESHAVYLDRPAYRGQRMLYPLLAGGFGLLPSVAIQWTMLLVNIAAVAVGTWATARLAEEMGGSPWLGLAFALNIGVISDMMIGGAGILALALGVLGVLALERHQFWQAVMWLALAALTREVMLLFVAGVALLALKRIGWRAIWLGLVPGVAVVAWAGYLRVRIDEASLIEEVREFGLPFQGIIESIPRWSERAIDPLVAGILFLLGIALLVRSVINPTYIGWGSVGFFIMSLFLSYLVWSRYFDITRALAPVMTAYVLVTFTPQIRRVPDS